jgi:hypothetical protein
MEFQAALGILVVIGFGYFIYRKVKASKEGKTGTSNGGIRPPNDDNQQER